jgi:hypothetical protein
VEFPNFAFQKARDKMASVPAVPSAAAGVQLAPRIGMAYGCARQIAVCLLQFDSMGGLPRFFIVGSGRCGSTLLRLLMSAQSGIYVTPETQFIIPLVERLPLRKILSADEVQVAIDIITTDYRWPDMEIATHDFRRWVAELHQPSLREIIDLVYHDLLRRSGKARLGDKSPPYITILPQLAALYPEAKFIHLIRDGRDVAISFIDVRHNTGYYTGELFEWILAVRKGFSYEDSEFSKRILDVRYEDLVQDTEAVLRKICTFLGETFEAGMLHGQRAVDALVPKRERGWHSKLGQPISGNAAGLWRHKLSGPECFLMESCLHKELCRLGYPLRFRGTAWQLLLRATGFGLNHAAPLLNRAIPALRRRNLLPAGFYI